MKLIKKSENKLNLVDNQVLFDAQNTSLKSGNDYVWRDEKASFIIKDYTGKNNPVWGVTFPGFEGIVFPSKTMSQVWVDFHIDHDIALNTRIYPHVHWMPLTNDAGVVRWGIQYAIAKGHGQSSYRGVIKTVYINHTVPANSIYKHMVSEVSDADSILSTEIEPDAVVKVRVFRDGAFDTYPGGVHGWQADLHHQVARIGTLNKAPNFYV